MRPGQKNRMRGGRGNSGGSRRGPNPLTRSYESNGPDVKVRGTPQHIAEKYVQLARDAHSAGDTVMTESYLQHAEHYYRIIAAAQSVQQAAYNQANGLPSPAADDAMDDEDEFEVAGADRFTFRAPQAFQQPQQGGFNGPGGQGGGNGFQQGGQAYGDAPGLGDQPAVGADGQGEGGQPNFQQRPPRQDRPQDRQQDRPNDRPYDRAFGDRRPFDDRQQGGRDRQGRRFGRDRNFNDRPFAERTANGEGRPPESRGPQAGGEERAPESQSFGEDQPGLQAGLPSFITAPVRSGEGEEQGYDGGEGEGGRFRNRRRRRPRVEGQPEPAGGGDEQV